MRVALLPPCHALLRFPRSAMVTPRKWVQDADVNVVWTHCPRLADLDLSGCLRVTGWGLVCIGPWEGHLSRLRLADTLPLRIGCMSELLGRAVRAARCAPLVGSGGFLAPGRHAAPGGRRPAHQCWTAQACAPFIGLKASVKHPSQATHTCTNFAGLPMAGMPGERSRWRWT